MANISRIQHLINSLNLGTNEEKAGDYLVGNLQAAAAVAPIASPSTVTTEQLATSFNELIAALNSVT